MSDRPTAAHLTLEQQQVLAFLSSYLHDNDCLPTNREIAVACGFGSAHTGARVVDQLELRGAITRDRRYRRIGTVTIDGLEVAIPEREQLWWCERDRVEYQATLTAIRIGIDLAPDLDALGFLHAEGQSRVSVLRALDDTRRRLRDSGMRLTPEGEQALQTQRQVADAANELLTSWDAYCAVRLIWNLSAYDGLGRVRPLALGYLGANLVASRRATEWLLPTYWSQARRWALGDDGVSPVLWTRLTELLGTLRQGRATQCPSHTEASEVDVHALLAAVS
jgi:hypothetical protein